MKRFLKSVHPPHFIGESYMAIIFHIRASNRMLQATPNYPEALRKKPSEPRGVTAAVSGKIERRRSLSLVETASYGRSSSVDVHSQR